MPLHGKSTRRAAGFLLGKISRVSIAVAGSGHPASPPAGHRALGWEHAAGAAPLHWTERRCADRLQMRGEGQKGTFRDGKSRGGGKELAVLPLTPPALNKRLLVL